MSGDGSNQMGRLAKHETFWRCGEGRADAWDGAPLEHDGTCHRSLQADDQGAASWPRDTASGADRRRGLERTLGSAVDRRGKTAGDVQQRQHPLRLGQPDVRRANASDPVHSRANRTSVTAGPKDGGTTLQIELSDDEALVLSDWLDRIMHRAEFSALVDERAVWSALLRISGTLETNLSAIFSADYSDQLEKFIQGMEFHD